MVRLRLDLSYDGTDFAGWAVQPGRRTVAGALGEALQVLFRAPVPLVVAGRTDAGVHATGQVAHIDVPVPGLLALTPRDLGGSGHGRPTTPDGHGYSNGTGTRDGPSSSVSAGSSGGRNDPVEAAALHAACRGLLRRLSGLLPADVRVRSADVAAAGFDARFAAMRRHYEYRIGTAEWGVEPLQRAAVWNLRRTLDTGAMERAAAALVGLHDFAAYCRPREGATTVRELQALRVRAAGDHLVLIEVTADAFCHSMVRSLVGALATVGEGRAPVDAPARLLAAARRTSEVRIAPARGLTLVGVDYPADADLAARVSVTRAVREPTGAEDSVLIGSSVVAGDPARVVNPGPSVDPGPTVDRGTPAGAGTGVDPTPAVDPADTARGSTPTG
ncbi:tRNA pseudouridine(38-40) synthase TruA [Nakamurella sp. YIM 132087]|uniref:tRNA pseudouridine synthase A n=1 Tax=Nakamurella alba TaxID=2665158 RepID=A0A7K1FJV0_9ACTN|nr:tRNA pseudouridine synthase A [Nakamurella alba]MTD14378.1 tRNA pseudouridine(38-40) synthase TruA [Nakamurella alba]